MPGVRKVLVVGGGIGGLTASIALRQAGIDAEIVEIKQEWTVYGVGIIQPNNQLRALDQVGLAARCIELGGATPGWHLCDANGNLQAEIPQSNAGAPNLPPINGISRPSLHRILSEAAREHSVAVRLGLTVSWLQDIDGGVEVDFSDGTRGSYDLVIGADGVYSKVRELTFGSGLKPRPTGQAVWRYNFPRPPEVTWGMMFYAHKSKAGLVPTSKETMYLLLVTPAVTGRAPEERLHILLRERLEEYGGIIAELAKGVTDPRGVVYKPMESLLVPPPWHRGRVVLIGDAAHATTPHLAQGASIAIEDGVLLGQLLGQNKPVEQALSEFSVRRFERCRLVVESSLQLGKWESLEWAGTPDPNADPAALMAFAWNKMTEPI